MTKEYLQWQDPTADSAIFGVDGHPPHKPRSIGSLTQAEIDEGIHLARTRLATGGSRAEYRVVTDMLRRARRQIQEGEDNGENFYFWQSGSFEAGL